MLDMTATLEYETQDDFETQVENISRYTLKKLALDNWLDSGYRLVLPEKDLWSSDDY